MKRTVLDRRAALRGIVGGAAITIPLPRLAIMMNGNATAYAAGAPLPRCFGLWCWGNGVRLDRWVPRQTGATWTPSDELTPLAPVKEYVTVVSGMQVRVQGRVHAAGQTALLTGSALGGTSDETWTTRGPSIDQIVADAIQARGSAPRLRSIEVGISAARAPEDGSAMLYFSHRAPNTPNVPSYDCGDVFGRLFGVVAGAGMDAQTQQRLDVNVVDAIRQDAADLRRLVGTEDRARLDQHLTALAELSRRYQASATACAAPPPPVPTLKESRLIFGATLTPNSEQMNATMARLIAMAISCDITRVFTFQYSFPGGTPRIDIPGEIQMSDPYHHQTHINSPDVIERVHQWITYFMRQLSVLVQTFRDVQEPGGSLLDRCAILATTDVAEGLTHSTSDYPMLVIGRGGGVLRAGIHYRSATSENACMVPFTLAKQVMGAGLTTFGTGQSGTNSTLGALLA